MSRLPFDVVQVANNQVCADLLAGTGTATTFRPVAVRGARAFLWVVRNRAVVGVTPTVAWEYGLYMTRDAPRTAKTTFATPDPTALALQTALSTTLTELANGAVAILVPSPGAQAMQGAVGAHHADLKVTVTGSLMSVAFDVWGVVFYGV